MNIPDVSTTEFNGSILLFYALDVGDEIDLERIRQKNYVPARPTVLSPYFKNYHLPLSFLVEEDDMEVKLDFLDSEMSIEGSTCISSKIHHFGVMSFCYKVPFKSSLDDLKLKLIQIKKIFDKKSEKDAKRVFDKILPTIKKPRFYSLKNFYFAVQVDPLSDRIKPEDFKNIYGSKIASLLRLEIESLSEYQREEILFSSTAYSGRDLMIIDSEASFIYDIEYFELIELFEFTTVQQLELQYFDRLLDEKLNFFYAQKSYKIPLKAYLPFVGERVNLPIFLLSQLRVDISVITERLENSIKMAGDTYFTKVYKMLREQLSLDDWYVSLNRKLDIIKDLYTVSQDRLDVIHEEVLTLVIIILIALEAILAFYR